MLRIPWLRIAIFVGWGVTVFSLLFLPSAHRDGTPLTPGERAVPLVVLTIVAILVLRIDQRRQREQLMRSDTDDQDLDHDRDLHGGADQERPPASSRSPEQ